MHSIDVRKIALNIYFELKSLRKTAALVKLVSAASIGRWVHDLKIKGWPIKGSIIDTVNIKKLIVNMIVLTPYVTVRELRDAIFTACNIKVSVETVRKYLTNNLEMSLKKAHYYPLPSQKTFIDKTLIFKQKMAKIFKLKKLPLIVSIDEVGFSSNVRPLMGWSNVGEKLHIQYVPKSCEKKHTSVCSAIDSFGRIYYRAIPGHYTKLEFLKFLNEFNYPPKTVLLMDNVSFHHSKIIIEFIQSRDWKLVHTPPYSPWFNPIENVFSLVKNCYRKCRDVSKAFNSVSPSAIINIINRVKGLLL